MWIAGVAGEVHGVRGTGVVALEPVHGGAVGGQSCWMNMAPPMRITSAASHIGSDLGGHKVTSSRAHQTLLQGDLLVVVVVLVGAVGQGGDGGLWLEVGILLEVLLMSGQ